MNDDENIRRYISDGDKVQHRLSLSIGIAFAQNKKGQWLVVWDKGEVDVVHSDFLARDSQFWKL